MTTLNTWPNFVVKYRKQNAVSPASFELNGVSIPSAQSVMTISNLKNPLKQKQHTNGRSRKETGFETTETDGRWKQTGFQRMLLNSLV